MEILVIGTIVMLAAWGGHYIREYRKARPAPPVKRKVKTPLSPRNPVKPRSGLVRRSREDYQAAGPYRLKKTPGPKVLERNRLYFDRIVAHLGEHHEEEFDVLVLLVEGWSKPDKFHATDQWFVMDCIRKGWLVPVTNVVEMPRAVNIDPMME